MYTWKENSKKNIIYSKYNMAPGLTPTTRKDSKKGVIMDYKWTLSKAGCKKGDLKEIVNEGMTHV